MEHVKDDRPAFYSELDRNGYIRVWQNEPRRPLLCLMGGNGFSKSEEVKWANRAARGLCYDTAGLQRAHRAGRMGFVAGMLAGIVGMLVLVAVLGLRLPSQCVDVGPYATVPNG